MTQHHLHTEFTAQGTHRKEQQRWSVRSPRVWDAAPAFSTVTSHFPWSWATTGESRGDWAIYLFTWAEESLCLCCSGHVGYGLQLSVKHCDRRTPKCPEPPCGWEATPHWHQCFIGRLSGLGTWQMGSPSRGLYRKDMCDWCFSEEADELY